MVDAILFYIVMQILRVISVGDLDQICSILITFWKLFHTDRIIIE